MQQPKSEFNKAFEDIQETPLYEDEEWNVYNSDVVEAMLEADELDPHEEAFMQGYIDDA